MKSLCPWIHKFNWSSLCFIHHYYNLSHLSNIFFDNDNISMITKTEWLYTLMCVILQLQKPHNDSDEKLNSIVAFDDFHCLLPLLLLFLIPWNNIVLVQITLYMIPPFEM